YLDQLISEYNLCPCDFPLNNILRKFEIKIRDCMFRKSSSTGLVSRKFFFLKQQRLQAEFSCSPCSRSSGRAAAYDDYVIHTSSTLEISRNYSNFMFIYPELSEVLLLVQYYD